MLAIAKSVSWKMNELISFSRPRTIIPSSAVSIQNVHPLRDNFDIGADMIGYARLPLHAESDLQMHERSTFPIEGHGKRRQLPLAA